MSSAVRVAVLAILLTHLPRDPVTAKPSANRPPNLLTSAQNKKTEADQKTTLTRKNETSLHIAVESAMSGVQYRCTAEGLPQDARSLTVWKTVDSDGSLLNTLHSSVLSAGRVDPRHENICQVLIDDGIFYQLLEKRLNISRAPGPSRLPQKEAPAFLEKRSTLHVTTAAGQRIATCAFAHGVIANAKTKWMLNGLELTGEHSAVLLLEPGWSGQLRCRYALLAWSEALQVQADRLLGVPELLYPARGRRAQFFPVWLTEPGVELNCSVQPSDSEASSKGQAKVKAGALPGWNCAIWSHSSLSGLGLIFVHSTAEDASSRKAELITTAQGKSGSSSFSTHILSESTSARRFRHLNDVKVIPGDVQGTLVCDPGLPQLQRDQAAQSGSATFRLPENLRYMWSDDSGNVLQKSNSASFVLKSSPHSIKSIQCLVWSASGKIVTAGQSKPFFLGNKLQPYERQAWSLWHGGRASLEVILKAPIRERSAPPSMPLTCELLVGTDQATDHDFCPKAARLLPRHTLKGQLAAFAGSTLQSTLYAVQVTLSDQQVRQFWHTASEVSAQDRFAPLNLRFLIHTATPTDLVGEQSITLLRSNHAPKISNLSADSDGQSILCNAEILDPDHDHYTLEWTSPQAPGKKVTTSTRDLRLKKQKGEQKFGFSAAIPLPRFGTTLERITFTNDKGSLQPAPSEAENPSEKGTTHALCHLTVSDGVLVETSPLSQGSGPNRHLPAQQLNSTAPKLPTQESNPLPFSTHSQQAQEKLTYAHLTGATYGPQVIDFPDNPSFRKIKSCTGLELDGSACPRLRLENARLVVQVDDSLFHGLYAVWLAGEKGSRTLAIIDIINGGLANPPQSSRDTRASCATLLQAARQGKLKGGWVDLATVPTEQRRTALPHPFQPNWVHAQIKRFQSDDQGSSQPERQESSEPIHCQMRFPDPVDPTEKQNERAQHHKILASSLLPANNLLLASLEAPIDTKSLLEDLIIRDGNPEIPPLLRVQFAQLCSSDHCVTPSDRLQSSFQLRDLKESETWILRANFETITGTTTEYSARISPIAVQYRDASPFVAQLYTKEKQSSRVQCTLAHTLLSDPSASIAEADSADEEFEFRFLSLERVVQTQLTASHTAEASENSDTQSRIDSCEVFKNGQRIARSSLIPSASSHFSCLATVKGGWRSRVPCTFTGRGAWEKLSFNNIRVNLGNLSESPHQFEAYWTSASGETEKGFVHLFERAPVETTQGKTPSRAAGTASTAPSSIISREDFTEPLGKALDTAPLRVFLSPQNLAQGASNNLATWLNHAPSAAGREQVREGLSADPDTLQNLGIECAAPASKKEQCTLIAHMIESTIGLAVLNGSRIQFAERSLESPYLLLYVWAYGEEDEQAPLFLGVSPLPQRLSKE